MSHFQKWKIEYTHMLVGKLGHLLDHQILGWELVRSMIVSQGAQTGACKWNVAYVFCCANIDEAFRVVIGMIRITQDGLEPIHQPSFFGQFDSTIRQC